VNRQYGIVNLKYVIILRAVAATGSVKNGAS